MREGAATNATGPMLELRSVTAGYGETTILRDVSLEVPAGGVVALLGPNGAGKTTLLRVASGLLRPRHGDVLLDGEVVTGRTTASLAGKGLCHIPEGRGIFPSLSVRENLRLSSPKGAESDGLERAVAAFPVLGQRMQEIAGNLSGGQQQMLAISRAYLANPKVVLVDEASMGLAPIVVDALFEFLGHLETSLLLVEQYVTRALELSDRAYVLSNGVLTFSGAASELDAERVFERYLNIELVD